MSIRLPQVFLACNPPLEVILHRMKARIDVLIKSEIEFNPTLVYLKKDYEDLERRLKESVIIE